MSERLRRDYPVESATAHPPSLFPDYKSTVKRSPKRPVMSSGTA